MKLKVMKLKTFVTATRLAGIALSITTSLPSRAGGLQPPSTEFVARVPTESGTICQLPDELPLTIRSQRSSHPLNISVPGPERGGLVALPSSPSAGSGIGYKAPGSLTVALNPPTGTKDITATPFAHTHRLEGRIRFEYVQRGPDIIGSFGEPNFPQYAH